MSRLAARSALSALAIAACVAAATPADAGQAGDLALARINAVAAGQVDSVVGAYAPNATLYWIGGPLNGVYTGVDGLKGVWTKFATAQGKLEPTVANLQEAGNPAGATVTADVVFKGKAAIPVRYVMTFVGGKLAAEIWQISPPNASY